MLMKKIRFFYKGELHIHFLTAFAKSNSHISLTFKGCATSTAWPWQPGRIFQRLKAMGMSDDDIAMATKLGGSGA
ncbi:MAG: hypothetical protein J6S82_11140 [Bacteroidales bacterium]|nr:hypothetical protein [Bacteroidales bacterium]